MPRPNRTRRALVRNSLLLFLAFCAVALLLLLWRQTPRPQAQLPEVSRADLVLRAGLWYQAGQTNPFTGWLVEFYQPGSLRSRSVVSNGLLNGVSEGWYTNGQIQVREHFKDGISHGWRQKWHENGSNLSEATIVEGKIVGTFRSWHDNGQLAEQIEMRQGNPDGVAFAYYPSGFLKARTRVEDGKILEQKSWHDGETRSPATE